MMPEKRRGGHVPVGRVRRMLPLVAATGRTAGDAVVVALQQRVRGTGGARAGVHQRAAERYVELLGRSRGVLMKAGQILSFIALGDVAGEQGQPIYRTALSRLQADAPPMPWEEAAAVVTEELGVQPDRAFASFEPMPFAAASIGQVHRARTRDGRDVAVKVQYPGVDQAIRDDLANVELLATFLRLGGAVMPDLPKLDTRALAAEVAARIGEELDYRTEAANQTEFADAYRGHPFIQIPEVLPELSTGRVLTMDYVDGLSWSRAAEQDTSLRDRWGEVIGRFAWGSLRRLRLANVDPHPGNYLFHLDGKVTFLDFGCVKRYTQDQVRAIIEMERGGATGDADRLWRGAFELGFIQAGDNTPEAREVGEWLAETWRPLTAAQPFTYTPEFGANVVRQTLSPVGAYSNVIRRMDVPPDFTLFLRMDAGLTAILCALGATGEWRAIAEELDGVGPPATALGRLEAAYWGEPAVTPRGA